MAKAVHPSTNFFLACLAVAGMLLLFSAGLSGQAVASGVSTLMNRPLNVPENFVITPFGYFHPSCVQTLAGGSTLLADGRVQQADGTIEAVQVCNYPHYMTGGATVAADAKVGEANPPAIDGWLEAVFASTSTSYYKITATWPVPPAPASNDGQVLYFFPGFEASNGFSILQPVLQWGYNGAFGGTYWQAASWNCCINGTAWYSAPINVSVADTILGTIVSTCKPGKNYCATWDVVSKDVTTGQKTTLATPADGQIWNYGFGAVTEDYNVVQCSDFPNDSGLTFTVHLYDQNGKVISNPGWAGYVASNPTPECNYGTKVTKTKETLKY
jgi:hypothetical protein